MEHGTHALVVVNDVEIERLTYRGFDVVTIDDIAKVHHAPSANIHKAFQRHRDEYTEGEDYFRLDFTEANQLGLKVQANPNGLLLFTEAGYLLLVKTMRDKLAWQIYKKMRADFFTLRALRESAVPEDTALTTMAVTFNNFMVSMGQMLPALRQQLQDHIESVAQNTLARIDDLQRDVSRQASSQRAHTEKVTARIEDLEKTVASMATVAAGPPAKPDGQRVWEFLRWKMHAESIGKLEPGKNGIGMKFVSVVPKQFQRAMEAWLFLNIVPVEPGIRREIAPGKFWVFDAKYTLDDLEAAYASSEHYGQEHLRKIDWRQRLRAEWEYAQGPGKVREMNTPKKYRPEESVG